MPFWTWSWAQPPAGFSWVFPLLGLAVIVLMVYLCGCMMAGRSGFGCKGRHGARGAGDVEDLRAQVRALEEELRKLRAAT